MAPFWTHIHEVWTYTTLFHKFFNLQFAEWCTEYMKSSFISWFSIMPSIFRASAAADFPLDDIGANIMFTEVNMKRDVAAF
jgi:hypothetical protein